MADLINELLGLTHDGLEATLAEYVSKMKVFLEETKLLSDTESTHHTLADHNSMPLLMTRAEELIGLFSVMKDIVVCKRQELTFSQRLTIEILLGELNAEKDLVKARLRWLEDRVVMWQEMAM